MQMLKGILWAALAAFAWSTATLAFLLQRTPLTPDMAQRLRALLGPR